MERLCPAEPLAAEVERLYSSGLSMRAVAASLGITEMMVRKRLKVRGVNSRSIGSLSPAGYVAITSLMKVLGRSQKSVEEIVKTSGVSILSIGKRNWVREEDIQKLLGEINRDYELSEVSWKERGITEWEMGWLGGVVDGEGCLQVCVSGNSAHGCTQVTNTCEAVIEKCEEILGKLGVVTTRHKGTDGVIQLRAKSVPDCWLWTKTVFPFLVLKKDDAKILIEFCELRMENKGRAKGEVLEAGKRLSATMTACRKDRLRGCKQEQSSI
jgi:hypothetical protein